MKNTSIAALTILASLAGFNAFADSGDSYQPQITQKFVSTLTRAQVHAEAVKAAAEMHKRGFNTQTGKFNISAGAASTAMGASREAVRAEALKARGQQMFSGNAS